MQFIARFTPNGDLLYFRYLPGTAGGTLLHVDPSGSIWLLASPDGTDFSPTYDLSDLIIQNPVRYLLRLDQEDGRVISSTKLQGKWTSIAVNSKGAVWLGGVARGRLTTTPDAFEPRNSRPTETDAAREPSFAFRTTPAA